MKTHAEFKDDVKSLARLIANEYADEVGIVFDVSDPEEPESEIATVSMELHRGGREEVFEVPFAIHNHETVIVGDRDSDIYLHANAGGLYAWLFLTCLTRLTDVRAKAEARVAELETKLRPGTPEGEIAAAFDRADRAEKLVKDLSRRMGEARDIVNLSPNTPISDQLLALL